MNNKEKIKYFYEYITSNDLVDEIEKYVANNCVTRIGEEILPIGMRQHIIDVRKTYPDLKMSIIRQYCDGDYIISEFIAEGTHEGEWLGMIPTGKKLTFTGVNIDKMTDGKIVEHGGSMSTFET